MPRSLRRECRTFTLNYTQLTHHTGKRKGRKKATLRIYGVTVVTPALGSWGEGAPAGQRPPPGTRHRPRLCPSSRCDLGQVTSFIWASVSPPARWGLTACALPVAPDDTRLKGEGGACERWGTEGRGRVTCSHHLCSGVTHTWPKSLSHPYSWKVLRPLNLPGLILTVHMPQRTNPEAAGLRELCVQARGRVSAE